MNLYITADSIGTATGGGKVTYHESEALKSINSEGCDIWGREEILDGFSGNRNEPWFYDDVVYNAARIYVQDYEIKLTHFYSGTFSKTVDFLRSKKSKVTYMAAAHDIEISKQEHEKLGLSYDFPHLTDPEQWKQYVKGYQEADVLICPSTHSANVMKKYGCKQLIEIIPHGVELTDSISTFPTMFKVGYLGAIGPDKGLIYLLQAWKELNYKDAMLVIAGRDSTNPFLLGLIEKYGGGCIHLAGWQNNVSDFYNSISIYCQPSASEGFGIEVLEAMAHGRPVICSDGAGAADCVDDNCGEWIPARDYGSIADAIDIFKHNIHLVKKYGINAWNKSKLYSWDAVKQRYIDIWKSLL